MQVENADRTANFSSEEFAQCCIRLPVSIGIVLRGKCASIFNTFVSKFALCKDAHLNGGIPLEMVAGRDHQVAPPASLSGELARLPKNHQVMVVYGRDHEVAASICEEGKQSCAWTDGGASHIGFYASDPMCFVLQSVLAPVLKEVFLSRQALLMHSAAVSFPPGVGAMFVADGGGGKTTTALAAMFAGAKLLSDDLAVVRCDADQATVEGIPERMNLTRDTLSFFPSLSTVYERFDEFAIGCRNKSPIAPHEILDDCVVDKSDLNVVYQIRVAADGPRAVRMPPAKALGLFVRAHTFVPAERMKPDTFARLGLLADKVKVYELTTGSDPNVLARWLIRHCRQHASGQA